MTDTRSGDSRLKYALRQVAFWTLLIIALPFMAINAGLRWLAERTGA